MKLIVLIDAGHGPETKGKRSPDGKLREFNFNHSTATMLISKLLDYEDVEFHTVYNPSEDTPLSTRVAKANAVYLKNKSDIQAKKTQIIYVSIHANANGSGDWDSASGIETYVYKKTLTQANSLAANVQTALIRETGRKNRGVKEAPFYVVKNTDMTAILVESGFMTNKEEAALLMTKTYQDKIATAIERGIVATYNLKKKKITTPPKAPSPTTPKPKPGVRYVVQAGAFSDRKNAEKLAQLLKQKGFNSFVKEDK